MLVQLAGEGLRRQNKSALQKILGKNPCMSPQVTNKAYHIGVCVVKINDQDFDTFHNYCICKKGLFKHTYGHVTIKKLTIHHQENKLEPEQEPSSPRIPLSLLISPPPPQQQSNTKIIRKRVYTREQKDRRAAAQRERRQKKKLEMNQ